jgi:hypothetical protein
MYRNMIICTSPFAPKFFGTWRLTTAKSVPRCAQRLARLLLLLGPLGEGRRPVPAGKEPTLIDPAAGPALATGYHTCTTASCRHRLLQLSAGSGIPSR